MHGRRNVHFEVQFLGHRKNPFTDAYGRRLYIHALMDTKKMHKKNPIYCPNLCKTVIFYFRWNTYTKGVFKCS